jgi:hypothetical protein
MAEGAAVDFAHLLIMNLRMEIDYFHKLQSGQGTDGSTNDSEHTTRARAPADSRIDQCSDYMIKTDSAALLIHNEDSGAEDRNNTFMLNATVVDGSSSTNFYAYVYSGDLPSGGFGWNEHRLGFSLNYVHPTVGVYPGLGRGFVSRSMLDATSLDKLVAAASVDGQCGGHNYQLVDFAQRRIINLEVGPHGQRFITELHSPAEQAAQVVHPPSVYSNKTVHTAMALYHSNQYLFMQLLGGQSADGSSAGRQQRAMELQHTAGLPTTAAQLREVMGDLVSRQYHI